MGITVDPSQREALLHQIRVDYSAFGDFESALDSNDYERAYRLGRRFADGFRLVMEGRLGWHPTTAASVELKLSPAEARIILSRMRTDADAMWASLEPERKEAEEEWGAVSGLRDACDSLLNQINSGGK